MINNPDGKAAVGVALRDKGWVLIELMEAEKHAWTTAQ